MRDIAGRRRRWWVLAALPVGIVFLVLALYSTGAGHGSYWAVILFYPLQFLVTALTHQAFSQAGSDLEFIGILAVLSLPWYPLLVYLFTARERRTRIFAVALVVLQVAAGVIVFVNV